MRLSPPLCAPGLVKRSLDEFRRFAKIAITQEGLTVPSAPYELLDFTDRSTTAACKTMSDADMGGFSSARLDFAPQTATTPAHARFHGTISTELPPHRPQIQRTGYSAWRSRDRAATIFGRSLWDIDPYTYLGLRVRSDGRKYFVNVQTETLVPTDLHQHRLYARRPGEWETVFIKWNDFVRTNHGAVVEPQMEMLRQKVRTIGIGLIDRVPGPFDLSIARIWATNSADAGQSADTEGDDGQSARDAPRDAARVAAPPRRG